MVVVSISKQGALQLTALSRVRCEGLLVLMYLEILAAERPWPDGLSIPEMHKKKKRKDKKTIARTK